VKRPAIITTPFPTLYEVADRMGVSHKRADEIAALMRSVEQEERARRKKAAKTAAQTRAARKGNKK
jgi:low affinity Fe/Cu permease